MRAGQGESVGRDGDVGVGRDCAPSARAWRRSRRPRARRRRPTDGISNRTSRSLSSMTATASTGAPGFWMRQLESPRRHRASGPAERLLGHRADGGLHFGLRRDVDRELGAGGRDRQPRRERLVAAEDVVGHHDGAGADLIFLGDRLSGLGDLVDGGGHAERRGERSPGRSSIAPRASSRAAASPAPYFISKRVMVKSKGAPVCPVEVMIQPEAVRASVTCSRPICVPRRIDAEHGVARRGSGRRELGRMPSPPRPARRPPPGRYNESALKQDNSTGGQEQDNSSGYAAVRHGAGLIDRAGTGRILLTGADRRSYLQGLLTNDIAGADAGHRLLRGHADGAGPHDDRHARARAGGRGPAEPAAAGHGGDPRPPRPVHLQRRRAGRGRDGVARRDRGLRSRRGATCSPRSAPKASAAVQAVRDHARARGRRGDRPRSGATKPGVPGYDILVDAADAEPVTAALLAAGAVRVSEADAEDRAHRERPPALRRRHGHRHDSARSRPRGARDLAEQGLLRRPGSDRARPGSRPGARGEAPRRPHVRCRRAGSGRRRAHPVGRTRDRPRDERDMVTRARRVPSRSATRTAISSSRAPPSPSTARARPRRRATVRVPDSQDAGSAPRPPAETSASAALRAATQRISWPSSGTGALRNVQARKCSSTLRSG